jgi:predicted ATP-dependent endonuclease of OLD family
VGANNSGKTALVEGLSLNFQNHIHKSLITFPTPSDVVNTFSGYEVILNVKKESILNLIDNTYESGKKTLIPLPDKYTNNRKDFPSQTIPEILNLENINNVENIEIQIRFIFPHIIPFDTILNLFSSSYSTPVEKLLRKNLDISSMLNIRYCAITNITEEGRAKAGEFSETIQYQIFQQYRLTLYKFDAERLNIGMSQTGASCELKSDASNLAEVLANLQGNPSRFTRFNKYVSIVLPDIKGVSVSPYNTSVQIKIWTLDPATEREDLAYPLSHCGTGVSQVLAILYVVITSQESRIIIIDEPQSFLHPGAARKLIEILKEFPQHQYFIATHSSATITAANPSTIVKLRHENNETKVLVMKPDNIKEQRDLLADLGVNLSDVFGADNVLWVEGPTEEQCFPIILEKIAKKPQRGTQILAVKNTGDFLEKKPTNLIFDIYDKLSEWNSLFPPAVGFIFDSELTDELEQKKLKKRSTKPVHFLPRRMYENYLLHSKAIAFIINVDDKDQLKPLSDTIVQNWIDNARNEICYLPKNSSQLLESDWLRKVDGSKFLHNLFSTLSEGRINFKDNKPKYCRKITGWLIDNEPEYLSELSNFLVTCLSKNNQ